MSRYRVLRPTGDYADRVAEANAEGAQVYLEQHFNAVSDPRVNHPLAKCLRGSPESYVLAVEYGVTVHSRRHVDTDRGPRVVQLFDGPGSTEENRRGLGSLRGLQCPGILMEPGFISNPAYAAWVRDQGEDALAAVIVHMVKGALPHGGVVALSVGHLGKVSRPDDRGAPVAGGGWEADLALAVVEAATWMLGRVS